eukprot:TRINITY_DN5080_c0_g1_i5.p1 TRINITY_DN5080_c0_g1~~TRINITY_DN5080_c0_g1_i5.p1  ORF type:complete len:536 (+),score=79.73 TRINITY_DN5080_c0_g1_i5:100-1707(+)
MKDASTKGAVFDKESLPIPTDPAPSVVYRFFRFLFTVILHIFFRDITVVGLENIPMDGNVILSGNHFNQFVDALLLVVVCPRPISFVAAEKTMRRKFLGWLSRKLRAIPVIRPQDRAKRGKGTITIRDTKIVGTDTQFTEEVELGGGILIATSELPLRVKQILSDTEILLDETMDKPHENIPYKCLPKIDQSKVFEAVWKFLGYKGCIGVFPEGGSHDRPELLPLKAGIAIMSLGFVSKYQEDSIVVPCGFTYFEGHRFRSQVVVEFGLPLRFSPHDDLAKTYNSNKKKAITDFLNEIRLGMESVTLTASSYVDIKAFQLARRLYEAEANVNIEKADRALLLRQISHVFKNHNDIRVQSLKNRLVEFQKKLASYGLDQSQVEHFSKSYAHAVPMILHRIFTIFITFLLAIPGLICAAPIAVACEVLSAREMRRAKANSVVKLEGKDVVSEAPHIIFMHNQLVGDPTSFFLFPKLTNLLCYSYFTKTCLSASFFFSSPFSFIIFSPSLEITILCITRSMFCAFRRDVETCEKSIWR